MPTTPHTAKALLASAFGRRRERLGLKPPGMMDGGEHDERAFEAWLRDAAIVKPPVPTAPPPPPPPKPVGPVRSVIQPGACMCAIPPTNHH